ncbi:MAG: hypothetical protein AAFP80_13390 [Pseudomonadota bacterium]
MSDPQSPFKFLKIYGERNTGTNFVEQLVLRNAPWLVPLGHRPDFNPRPMVRQFPKSARHMAYQRIVDLRREQEVPDHLGWKHAYAVADEQRLFSGFDSTFFIFIVRNPYYFISSLFRRPYDITPASGFFKSKFVRQPILLNERDNISWTATVSGPAELWSLKSGSYVKAAAELKNAVLVRYEDLVSAPDDFVLRLAQKGLVLPDDYELPHKSTKGDKLTFDDYAKRAQSYDPKQDFSSKSLEVIAGQLDPEIVKALDYTLVK